MGLLERTFVITDDNYDVGCGLQEYNGTYSLVEAKKGEKKTFMKWVYPQKYDQDTKENYPGDKAFPKSVAIAEGRVETIQALEGWIEILKGGDGNQRTTNPQSREETPSVMNDDIPF